MRDRAANRPCACGQPAAPAHQGTAGSGHGRRGRGVTAAPEPSHSPAAPATGLTLARRGPVEAHDAVDPLLRVHEQLPAAQLCASLGRREPRGGPRRCGLPSRAAVRHPRHRRPGTTGPPRTARRRRHRPPPAAEAGAATLRRGRRRAGRAGRAPPTPPSDGAVPALKMAAPASEVTSQRETGRGRWRCSGDRGGGVTPRQGGAGPLHTRDSLSPWHCGTDGHTEETPTDNSAPGRQSHWHSRTGSWLLFSKNRLAQCSSLCAPKVRYTPPGW